MREVNVVAGRARSAGKASANVCRIARADERIASARDEPIVAVIHGARTSSLKGCSKGRLRIHAPHAGLPRQTGEHRLPRELREGREVERPRQGRERVRGGEDRRPAAHREHAQAARRLERLVGLGVLGVVEADLLEERDVDRVGVGVEELRAEVDGDAVAPVLDRPRVAVPADPAARLEELHVVRAGEEVGGGDAARPRADDGDALAPRGRAGGGPAPATPTPIAARPAAPFSASRRVIGAPASMHGTR